jgi:hypothetical protein
MSGGELAMSGGGLTMSGGGLYSSAEPLRPILHTTMEAWLL